MSYPASLHMGTGLSRGGVKNEGIAPHPVPLPWERDRVRGASFVHGRTSQQAGAYASANAARSSRTLAS